MPIIIDGWNMVRSPASGIDYEDDLAGASELIRIMNRFQETHADPVILVFDSKNEYLDIPMDKERFENRSLRVVAAKNADDYIKRYIDEVPERQRRNIRAVSSDRSLYLYARNSGATPIKCEEFWEKV